MRIEQLSPFPYEFLKETLEQYKNAKFVYVQEEHENQGGWYFARPRVRAVLQSLVDEGKLSENTVSYVGRSASCSPAVGKLPFIFPLDI